MYMTWPSDYTADAFVMLAGWQSTQMHTQRHTHTQTQRHTHSYTHTHTHNPCTFLGWHHRLADTLLTLCVLLSSLSLYAAKELKALQPLKAMHDKAIAAPFVKTPPQRLH